MSSQNNATGELSTLVGGLLTVAALLVATMAALVSSRLAVVVGLALLALAWIGLRGRAPRVLALITGGFGVALLGLALLTSVSG